MAEESAKKTLDPEPDPEAGGTNSEKKNKNSNTASSEQEKVSSNYSFENGLSAASVLSESIDASVDDDDDEEEAGEEEDGELKAESGPPESTKLQPPLKKGPLEYDLYDMYPELDLLIKQKRRDWNFNDPAIIRAIWLESKTHILSDWKPKFARIQTIKPALPVQLNYATQLRNEYRQMEKEREEIEIAGVPVGRDAPYFGEMRLPTTATAQMRYKLVRDNPPVPEYFIHHFSKFKKPPFLKNNIFGKQCKDSSYS